MLSFMDFGAVGNGLADDTAAIVAALSSGEPIINNRDQTFLCGTAVVENAPVFLRGGRIKGSLRFDNSQAVRCDIDDVDFIAPTYGGVALKITHTPELCQLRRDRRTTRIGGGVTFAGLDAETGGFQAAIWLKDVNRAQIGAVQIAGERNGAEYRAGSKGIVVEGTVQPTLIEIDNPHVRATEMAIHLIGEMEGVHVSRARIPSCRWGVYADWSSMNPSFRVTDSHINARERCVKAKRVYEAKITGNEFYRFVNVGGPGAWAGVEAIDFDRSFITGNTFSGDPDPFGKPKTTDSHAIRLGANVLRCASSGNRGYGIDAGVFGSGDMTDENAWEIGL